VRLPADFVELFCGTTVFPAGCAGTPPGFKIHSRAIDSTPRETRRRRYGDGETTGYE